MKGSRIFSEQIHEEKKTANIEFENSKILKLPQNLIIRMKK